MTKVLIISEDRTGSGLQGLLRAAAQAERRRRGAPPLAFPNLGSLNGNAELLESCRKYHLYRFNSPKVEHVFYVMDARRSWALPDMVALHPPNPANRPWVERSKELIPLCREAMTRRAQQGISDWPSVAGGFHPHVLVWERESLMLPVLDALALGQPEPEPYGTLQAFELVRDRFNKPGAHGYAKGLHGAQFLDQIAQSPDLIHRVLASNASVREIVAALVAL